MHDWAVKLTEKVFTKADLISFTYTMAVSTMLRWLLEYITSIRYLLLLSGVEI